MQLDHIAIAGETLQEAAEWVEAQLGVSLQQGGQHAVFGTHNRLLGLADGLYLEAIAVDPDAETPARPRWFDLDRFSGRPRITNWICQTNDMDRELKGLPATMGQPVALTRGDLAWRMAVPHDGILPFDNCAPALIQWQSGVHPSLRLADAGCRLQHLQISHPAADGLLPMLTGFRDPRVRIERGQAAIRAEIATPHGMRVLE